MNANHEQRTDAPEPDEAEVARRMAEDHADYLRELAVSRERDRETSPVALMRKLETMLPGSTAGLPVGGLLLRKRA